MESEIKKNEKMETNWTNRLAVFLKIKHSIWMHTVQNMKQTNCFLYKFFSLSSKHGQNT